MILWAILTITTAAAAVLLSVPLTRRYDQRLEVSAADIAVYRDQLAAVEKEEESGLIDTDQAEASRAEIKRRILAAASLDDASSQPISNGHRHLVTIAVVSIVVFGGVGLYAATGRPELPSSVPAQRVVVAAATPASDAILPNNAQPAPVPTAKRAAQPLGTVDEMIERLQMRLQANPDDGEGWRMLGWSFFSTDRYSEAATAYAKAVALTPKKPGLKTAWGEAVVRVADGKVTPDALQIFDEALALDAKDPRARFFKGLVLEQKGNGAAALEAWVAILKDARNGDTWAPELRKRITELSAKLGKDVSGRLPGTPAQVAKSDTLLDRIRRGEGTRPATLLERGPSPADVRSAQAMIRGMVNRLTQRLKTSPRDADGWIKLMRSRMVLGETAAAKAALTNALATFEGSPQEQTRIADSARRLGVIE